MKQEYTIQDGVLHVGDEAVICVRSPVVENRMEYHHTRLCATRCAAFEIIEGRRCGEVEQRIAYLHCCKREINITLDGEQK